MLTRCFLWNRPPNLLLTGFQHQRFPSGASEYLYSVCGSSEPASLDKALRIYAWFLLIVTVLPAAARLAKPRELARIVMVRYQNPRRRRRARIGGMIYLGLSLLAIPFLATARLREERWLILAVLVGMVSAMEFVLNSRAFQEEILARQNRIFGGVYAAIAIAIVLLLFTR
ncbi:MAG TPA: hypothetical protein VL240_08645 [Candidatus Binatia bacterium]|nr:hypothetical protein [Candidatus Binatia bacterium]